MGLLTSCPVCSTTFRVTDEQLRVKDGLVRCGRCRQVFNALEYLSPDEEKAAADEPLPVASSETIAPAPVSETLYRPDLHAPAQSRAWANGVIALTLAGLLQLAFVFRAEIAHAWPTFRAPLERLCAALGCEVAYARELKSLAIDSSELEADPVLPNAFILHATVRNLARYPVEYPSLELSLIGLDEDTVAIRTFFAAEYVSAGARAARAWPAGREHEIRLRFTTGALKANGYRLRLIYR